MPPLRQRSSQRSKCFTSFINLEEEGIIFERFDNQVEKDQDSVDSYPSSPSSGAPSTPSDAPSPSPSRLTTRRGRKEHPDYIPRPRNAFIIFRSDYVKSQNKDDKEPQHELSKVIGRVWKGMTEAEKKPFYHKACQEKDYHEAAYPDYIFSPVRKIRSNLATSVRKRKPKATMRVTSTSRRNHSEPSSEFSSPVSSVPPSLPTSKGISNDFIATADIPAFELPAQYRNDTLPSSTSYPDFDHPEYSQYEKSPEVQNPMLALPDTVEEFPYSYPTLPCRPFFNPYPSVLDPVETSMYQGPYDIASYPYHGFESQQPQYTQVDQSIPALDPDSSWNYYDNAPDAVFPPMNDTVNGALFAFQW